MKQEGERRVTPDGLSPKGCPRCAARYPADALFCSLDGAPLSTSPGGGAGAPPTDPYLGRELLGHIEIQKLVGIGSMGRVYRAFQRGMDRDLAVKILHRELSSNETLVARFHREAKVASRLSHPNVVNVLLVGQLPDGAMYLVMEFLDGMSLQSALAAAGGAMPLPRALHIALQICEAAGEANAQKVVHRDLKPENVMLVHRADDPDFVKVLDFGIARLNWSDPTPSTAAGLIFGTARYISPEGAQGERVGPPGDVYAIATMLYQMLSGRTPFEAEQAMALLVRQIHDAPPPLKSIARAAYVPEPVAAVIMQNLAKQPEARALDARVLGRALLEASLASGLSAQDILARPSLLGPRRGAHASVVQMPSLERTKQHTLAPEVAARLVAPPDSPRLSSSAGPTEFESPPLDALDPPSRVASRTEVSEPKPPGPDATLDDHHAHVAPTLGAVPPLETTLADAPVRGRPKGRAPVLGPLSVGLLVAAALAGAASLRSGSVARGLVSSSRGATSTAPTPPDVEIDPRAGETGAANGTSPTSSTHDDRGPVPPLASADRSGVAEAPLGASVRVALDVSSSRPGVGQPVDLSARANSAGAGARPKLEGARFRIAGPGLSNPAELPAADDGSGIYRSTFTFLQPGRFEVAFGARASGAPVRAARGVVVDAVAAAAAASAGLPASSASPLPAPAAPTLGPTSPADSTRAPPPKWL